MIIMMMKNRAKILIHAALIIIFSLQVKGQDITKTIQPSKPDIKDTITKKDNISTGLNQQVSKGVGDVKTNTAKDFLTDFYQLGLTDLSGTSKSLTFVASINAIESDFQTGKAKLTPTPFENNFQPDISFGYKNNFQNINTSVGFKYAVINQTDAKNSTWLNNDKVLQSDIKKLIAYDLAFNAAFTTNFNTQKEVFKKALTDTTSAKATAFIKSYEAILLQNLKSDLKDLTTLELSADTTKFTKDLKAVFNSAVIKTKMENVPNPSYVDYTGMLAEIKSRIKDITTRISNGWNVTINPLLTYDITHTGVQGVNLGASEIKGFVIFDTAHISQLITKFNYVVGTDTIVSKINTARKQLTDEVGFNQVLASSIIKSISKTGPTPWLELSLTAGYNYVFDGLKPNENPRQPSLNMKLGILIGKSTWLTAPLAYNFGTKAGTALISLQINFGTAPISN